MFVKPNAGLPNPDGSYDLTPADFAREMEAYLSTGISMAGGCCGTTPESIRLLKQAFAGRSPAQKVPLRRSVLCTPVRCVEVDGITVVGERINPTGKKRLQQALREGDTAYPCAQAVSQAEAGAQVLDVNVGLPGIDEPAVLGAPGAGAAKRHRPALAAGFPPTRRRWPARCASITASPSSTRSTASRKRWTPSCRCAKNTARRWWA